VIYSLTKKPETIGRKETSIVELMVIADRKDRTLIDISENDKTTEYNLH
jgi:hypothetical protein